jgi:hypothetical protein
MTERHTTITEVARKLASTGGLDRLTAVRMLDAFEMSAAEAYRQREEAMEAGDFDYAALMSHTQGECNVRARAARMFLLGYATTEWEG